MLRFGGMWGIWLNRNNLIFNQKKFHIIEVVEHVKIKVWNWMKAKVPGFGYSLSAWLSNPIACIGIVDSSA